MLCTKEDDVLSLCERDSLENVRTGTRERNFPFLVTQVCFFLTLCRLITDCAALSMSISRCTVRWPPPPFPWRDKLHTYGLGRENAPLDNHSSNTRHNFSRVD